MMTREAFDILCIPAVQHAIEERLADDPLRIALDKRLPHAALIASQVKYLQRARTKLPTHYAARCILPGRAFEQASSAACAARKSLRGKRVLDLTCGLGVDALHLAEHFEEVVTLERDPLLAEVARENFRRLGVRNIRVENIAAEEYLARCTERFDWIYADPDRRDRQGNKQLRLEACSPDLLSLRDELRRVSDRLCVKNSPLFDVDETFRLFGACRTEVVSLHDECKEVTLYADNTGPQLTAVALGRGEFTAHPAARNEVPPAPTFDPARYSHLVIPDVALQKARLMRRYLHGTADCWSENGYGLAERPVDLPLVRCLRIERAEPYDPKALRRTLRGKRVTILKREVPWSSAQIAKQLGVQEGGSHRIALTRLGDRYWTLHLTPEGANDKELNR